MVSLVIKKNEVVWRIDKGNFCNKEVLIVARVTKLWKPNCLNILFFHDFILVCHISSKKVIENTTRKANYQKFGNNGEKI